uniref:Uncharacterized protein n=1 Tax=Parascaris equorum TaxID=6256 RepID=A0A914RC73_PAREQ
MPNEILQHSPREQLYIVISSSSRFKDQGLGFQCFNF